MATDLTPAVEAAAEAVWRQYHDSPFTDATPMEQHHYRETVLPAVTAATPVLLAGMVPAAQVDAIMRDLVLSGDASPEARRVMAKITGGAA